MLKTKPLVLSEEDLRRVFQARCEDFNLKQTEDLFRKFCQHQSKKAFLKVFEMPSCSIGPKSSRIISEIVYSSKSIRVIDLSNNCIGDQGAVAISDLLYQSNWIISVDISANSIGDSGMEALFSSLRSNRALVSLSVGSKPGSNRNSIGRNAAVELSAMLSENKVLSSLDISMTEISGDIVDTIAKGLSVNTTLQYLNLSNNNLQTKGASRIVSSLSKIQFLDLSDNYIKDEISQSMIQFFARDPVKSLNLSENTLTSKFVQALSNPISQSNSICMLDISRNPIGGQGAIALGVALVSCASLVSLNASSCKIDSLGFSGFCERFEANKTLEELNLGRNPLKDVGFKKFAKILKTHPKLRELDLELCEITDEGAKLLVEAIEISPALEKVSLKNNLLRSGGLIQKAVLSNQKLTSFNIEYNDIEYKTSLGIQRIVSDNFKSWQERQGQKVKDDVGLLKDVEGHLQDVRENIISERNTIEALEAEAERAEMEAEAARDHKAKTISSLEAKLEEASKRLAELSAEIQKKTDDGRNTSSELDMALGTIIRKCEREADSQKILDRALANLESRISEAGQQISKERVLVEAKKKEALIRYNDMKDMAQQKHRDVRGPDVQPAKLKSAKKIRRATRSSKDIKISKPEKKAGKPFVAGIRLQRSSTEKAI